MLSVPADRRALVRSLPPLTASVVDVVCPVWKKSLTLFGCAIHGAPLTFVNCWQGTLVSYVVDFALKMQPLVRPSSFGPQLWSAPSFTPPPAPSTYRNSPPAPCPY